MPFSQPAFKNIGIIKTSSLSNPAQNSPVTNSDYNALERFIPIPKSIRYYFNEAQNTGHFNSRLS